MPLGSSAGVGAGVDLKVIREPNLKRDLTLSKHNPEGEESKEYPSLFIFTHPYIMRYVVL